MTEHWLFNTDETEPEGEGKHEGMLRHQVIAAWGHCRGRGAEATLNRPKPGDVVYFFRARHGIIARGVANATFASASQLIFRAPREFARPVDNLQVLADATPITVAEIKEATGYQIPYRQIVGQLRNSRAIAYLDKRFERIHEDPPVVRRQPKCKPFAIFQPDPELRTKVEKAAIRIVKAKYRRDNWKVVSVERENVGYDLHCTKDGNVECVEVKGASGARQDFVITANELNNCRDNGRFVLYVVTNVLTKPLLHRYTNEDVWSRFRFEPVQFRALLQPERAAADS